MSHQVFPKGLHQLVFTDMVDQPLPEGGDDAASYRYMKEVRKKLRNLIDPFLLPDFEFIKKFRLSKCLVRELIQDVSPYIAFGGHGGAASCRFH